MTEQEMREKVIKGLECCLDVQSEWKDARYVCPTCTYTDNGIPCETLAPLMEDTLALLKAQEPRVMTLEEVKSASGYVIVQYRSCNILELQLIKYGFVYDSFTDPIAVDDLWWEGYNKHWRSWTSVPTDAQMEAVKWQ